ncbi:D-2-hydroxyacid dehydrogenase [Labrys miyagiensis]|uniref:D-2-hydroxyacid dehydrogenase n=2 Tax=Labrys miyagiensis TaxID=346912 RepID=A0ABQ6CIM5_9HYPH|nr:D-2-hydroxyacid dehydrogenase [Labrys miyagiensis]
MNVSGPVSAPQSYFSMPHVLMLGPYPDWDMLPMEASYRLHKLWEQEGSDTLAENRNSVRAIATRGELGANKALIDALPNLEIIACYGVGTDAIDLPTARERRIRVTNTPDVLTGDVADIAVGLALATMRRLPAGDAHVRSGAWAQGNMGLVTRFHGKKVGIVGFGRIGSTIARRVSGFDVEIGYFDRSARSDAPHLFFPDILALAAWSDVLIVTLAGGASTHKLVGAEVFRALGPKGFLVNVSRGSTIDEPALLDALESKIIAGAGLDVFWNEPSIDPRFAAIDTVVLQPHHASGTVETRQAMGQLVRDNLAAHFAGRPLLTPVA